MQNKQLSFSNILILFSIIATLGVIYNPNLYQFGMNRSFLDRGIYHIWLIQCFTSQFLHGGLLHLFSNSIFVLYFGNILEQHIGFKKMILFFILSSLFIGLGLTFLHAGNTVGISGFALAILTYYTLLLKKRGNPEYTGGITAIILNIGLGLVPGISFYGHFLGMLFGAVYFFIQERVLKR